MLKRYADEVSHYQAQGESKEKALLLVRPLLISSLFPLIYCNYSTLIDSFGFRSYTHQSYQLAEELARAFTERTIFQIFLEAEMSLPPGPLKVNVFILLNYILF